MSTEMCSITQLTHNNNNSYNNKTQKFLLHSFYTSIP